MKENENTKSRLIVLTDIAKGFEPDDRQSMARLLLYSDVIDIEAMITNTSCWQKKMKTEKNKRYILEIIDAYGRCCENLRTHSKAYPSPDALRSKVFAGIPKYGKGFGDGFCETEFNGNEGVNRIIEVVDGADERPVWIALWGGANTLAQAVWKVRAQRNDGEFFAFLSKLRVYAISDQDAGGYWLRKEFGDKLFYIVSPSPQGSKYYYRATWPGISADKAAHGSESGVNGGGFKGADSFLSSNKWVKSTVKIHKAYGKIYPYYSFILEGDTPSYLGLIPNGLNCPERPDYGGWGGRYKKYIPDINFTGTEELFPVWTNSSDSVTGKDGQTHTSPQSTIWRWRDDFQADFAARLAWTDTVNFENASHAPEIILSNKENAAIKPNDEITLDASRTRGVDNKPLKFLWQYYKEAGTYNGNIEIENADSCVATIKIPADFTGEAHIILSVCNAVENSAVAYKRVILSR